MDRQGRLKGTVSAIEGELAVVRNANTILSPQLDKADEYSRRSCMILTVLGKSRKDQTNDEDSRTVISAITSEAGLDEREFMKHVGGTKKHNQNKKNEIEKRKQNPKQKSLIQLNVQSSLSRFRTEQLKKANEAIEDNVNFKLVYADMHGNLKLF